MAAAAEKPATVTLMSSEKDTIDLDEPVALLSETVDNLIADLGPNQVIDIPAVDTRTLKRITAYMVHLYQEQKGHPIELAGVPIEGDWRRPYLASETPEELDDLFKLILAANFLNVPEILDETTAEVGRIVLAHTPAELRKIFRFTS